MAREAGKVRVRSAAKMRGTGRADKGLKKAPDELISHDAPSGAGEEEAARTGADINRQDVRRTAADRFNKEADSGYSQKYWGIISLFVVVPFFLFCLCAPEKVGIIGVGVNEFLFAWLGIAAWIVPLLGLSLALVLLTADAVLAYSLKVSALLFAAGMMLTAGRMGRHAGIIGNYIDQLLTGFIGPVGAWMLAVFVMAFGMCKLWQITSEDILEFMTVAGQILEKLFRTLGRFSVWLSKVFCKSLAGVAKHIREAVDSFYSQGSVYNEDSRARSRNRMADRQLRAQERAKQKQAYGPADENMVPARPVGLVRFEDDDNAVRFGKSESPDYRRAEKNETEAFKNSADAQPGADAYDDCLFGWNDEDELYLDTTAGQGTETDANPRHNTAAGRPAVSPEQAGDNAAPAACGGMLRKEDNSAASRDYKPQPLAAVPYTASSAACADVKSVNSADEIERAAELGAKLRQSAKASPLRNEDMLSAGAAAGHPAAVKEPAGESAVGMIEEKQPASSAERSLLPAISDAEKAVLRKRLLGSTIPRAKHLSDRDATRISAVRLPAAGTAVSVMGEASASVRTEEMQSPQPPAAGASGDDAAAAVNGGLPSAGADQPSAEEEQIMRQQAEIQAAKAEARANWLANQQRLRNSLQRQAQRRQQAKNKGLPGTAGAVAETGEAAPQPPADAPQPDTEPSVSPVKAAADTMASSENTLAESSSGSQEAVGMSDFWLMHSRTAGTASKTAGSEPEKGKSTEIGQVVVRPSSYNPLNGSSNPDRTAVRQDVKPAAAAVAAAADAPVLSGFPSEKASVSAASSPSSAQKDKKLRNFWRSQGSAGAQTQSVKPSQSVKPVWAAVGVSGAMADNTLRADFSANSQPKDTAASASSSLPSKVGVSAAAAVKAQDAERKQAMSQGMAAAPEQGSSAAADSGSKKDRLRSFWGGKRLSSSPAPRPAAGGTPGLIGENNTHDEKQSSHAQPEPAASPKRTMGRGRNVWADLEAKRQAEAQSSAAASVSSALSVPSLHQAAEPQPSALKRGEETKEALPLPARKMLGHGRNVWAELEAKRNIESSAARSDSVQSDSVQPKKPEKNGSDTGVTSAAGGSVSAKFKLPEKIAFLKKNEIGDMPTMAEDADSSSRDSVSSSDEDVQAAALSSSIESDTSVRGGGEAEQDVNDDLPPLAITEEDYSDADDLEVAPEPKKSEAKPFKGLGAPRLNSGMSGLSLGRLGIPKLSAVRKDNISGGKGGELSKPALQRDKSDLGLKLPDFLRVKAGDDPKPRLSLNLDAPANSKAAWELPAARRAPSLPITASSLSADKHTENSTVGNLALNLQPAVKLPPVASESPAASAAGKGKEDAGQGSRFEIGRDTTVQKHDGSRESSDSGESGQSQASLPEPGDNRSGRAEAVPKVLSIGGASANTGMPVVYRLPSIALLSKPEPGSCLERDEDQSALLVDALASFKVSGKVVNVVSGPAVTRYEVEPARGVSVKKFTNLRDDLARCLAAKTLRIEAPVPGKPYIGIEVPKKNVEMVSLYDVIASDNYRSGKGLCFGLGKDIAGEVQVADLGKMPHLLIAGTTGSGKSVCINTIILSLIYRFTPSNLQMLMIDPKQVELSIYEGIPHLIGLADDDSKIVCDAKKAAVALNQMVGLMEARYALFAKQKVRNLKEYNAKAETKLPWVVVIIDELADLIMVAQKPVETAICRLAQKARAAGILMIVATQRPSADVLTGLIRSNIPSRISFAVPSQVESRIILDAMGAEDLLGKGDMLFKPVAAPAGIRIQGAYVTNEEIERVVAFWSKQAAPENRIEISVQEEPESAEEEESSGDGSGDADEEMIQNVLSDITNGSINRDKGLSASSLQSMYRIGYSRARRLVEQMEKRGYVGPQNGSKPREIYYSGT